MSNWRNNLTPYNNVRNRPPDSRFNHSNYPNAPRVRRGIIYNLDLRGSSPVVSKRHVFHFLTNPWEISLGYQVQEYPDWTLPQTYDAVWDGMAEWREGLHSVSFSILLDRTYEVWDGSLPEGVLHDIAQLEKVLGMPDRTSGVGGIETGRDMVENLTRTPPQPAGTIMKRPVRVLFGGAGARQAYSFDGFISSLSVTLMKFSKNMTPTRAGMNISMSSWGSHGTDDRNRAMPTGRGGIGEKGLFPFGREHPSSAGRGGPDEGGLFPFGSEPTGGVVE